MSEALLVRAAVESCRHMKTVERTLTIYLGASGENTGPQPLPTSRGSLSHLFAGVQLPLPSPALCGCCFGFFATLQSDTLCLPDPCGSHYGFGVFATLFLSFWGVVNSAVLVCCSEFPTTAHFAIWSSTRTSSQL